MQWYVGRVIVIVEQMEKNMEREGDTEIIAGFSDFGILPRLWEMVPIRVNFGCLKHFTMAR